MSLIEKIGEACGAQDMGSFPATPEEHAQRILAQLAAEIVKRNVEGVKS